MPQCFLPPTHWHATSLAKRWSSPAGWKAVGCGSQMRLPPRSCRNNIRTRLVNSQSYSQVIDTDATRPASHLLPQQYRSDLCARFAIRLARAPLLNTPTQPYKGTRGEHRAQPRQGTVNNLLDSQSKNQKPLEWSLIPVGSREPHATRPPIRFLVTLKDVSCL